MNTLQLSIDSLVDTAHLGGALAASVPDGTVVCLNGTLGAGKTQLVRDVASALAIDEKTVLSPTFVLCQCYQGTRQLVHIDAYRISDSDEFESLGFSEYFYGPSLTFIEWGERVSSSLPPSYLEISILIEGEFRRRVDIRSVGDLSSDIVSDLNARCESLRR